MKTGHSPESKASSHNPKTRGGTCVCGVHIGGSWHPNPDASDAAGMRWARASLTVELPATMLFIGLENHSRNSWLDSKAVTHRRITHSPHQKKPTPPNNAPHRKRSK